MLTFTHVEWNQKIVALCVDYRLCSTVPRFFKTDIPVVLLKMPPCFSDATIGFFSCLDISARGEIYLDRILSIPADILNSLQETMADGSEMITDPYGIYRFDIGMAQKSTWMQKHII